MKLMLDGPTYSNEEYLRLFDELAANASKQDDSNK